MRQKASRVSKNLELKPQPNSRFLSAEKFCCWMNFQRNKLLKREPELDPFLERQTKKMSLENVAVQAKNPASTKHKQKKHKNQILELRQKIYSNLKEKKNVFSILKTFQLKVEKFLRDFRTDLSYDEEKCWRDKVIITEEVVIRRKI